MATIKINMSFDLKTSNIQDVLKLEHCDTVQELLTLYKIECKKRFLEFISEWGEDVEIELNSIVFER